MKERLAQESMPRRQLLRFLVLSGMAPSICTAEATPAVHAKPVAEGVWFVQGKAALGSADNRNFISNAGFVFTDDGVVVIDALGSPTLANELITEIRRVTRQPIRYLIVTRRWVRGSMPTNPLPKPCSASRYTLLNLDSMRSLYFLSVSPGWGKRL